MKNITNGKRFLQSIEKYTEVCDENERLPNLAGYLRFMGMTEEEYTVLCEKFPKQSQLARSVFEDEALNSGLSATLISAYLKRHLGYGEKSEAASKSSMELDQLKLVFEHDIYEDGE